MKMNKINKGNSHFFCNHKGRQPKITDDHGRLDLFYQLAIRLLKDLQFIPSIGKFNMKKTLVERLV